jgi:hypothetical protein
VVEVDDGSGAFGGELGRPSLVQLRREALGAREVAIAHQEDRRVERGDLVRLEHVRPTYEARSPRALGVVLRRDRDLTVRCPRHQTPAVRLDHPGTRRDSTEDLPSARRARVERAGAQGQRPRSFGVALLGSPLRGERSEHRLGLARRRGLEVTRALGGEIGRDRPARRDPRARGPRSRGRARSIELGDREPEPGGEGATDRTEGRDLVADAAGLGKARFGEAVLEDERVATREGSIRLDHAGIGVRPAEHVAERERRLVRRLRDRRAIDARARHHHAALLDANVEGEPTAVALHGAEQHCSPTLRCSRVRRDLDLCAIER